jgi:regulatory protein
MPGTITALEIQKRNKERVNVYLDGEFAFGLTLLEAARLHRGQSLSEAEIEALKAQDEIERAVEQTVQFLSYRPRSITEIQRSLKQKGISPSAIDSAINRLETLGYVDDLAFARYWVANRNEFKPKGPLALRQELRQKGISNSIIELALEDVDFYDAACRAIQKRAMRWQSLDRSSFRQKAYEYLARRGFYSETIRDVISQLLEELEIPENDTDYDTLWE